MKSFVGYLLASTLLASAAQAQTVTEQAAEGTHSEDPAAAETIVVTGSRTIRNGDSSPTPVTIMTIEQLTAAKPTTVFEGLLDIPAFAGSRGGTSSNPTGNQANSGQISALNLRGLGPVRTLILHDGHRLPPTQQDGFVDANTVPEMLLERVDVATGGASAVYGSDAIGGVVNFITNRNFNGLKLEAQTGIAQKGDAWTWQLGGAFGTKLGDRGHIEASFQAFHDDGIVDRNDREQFRGRWTVQGNGCPNGPGSTNCVPFYLVSGANAVAWTYGGRISGPANTPTRTNPLLNMTFDAAGSPLRPFVNGTPVPGSTAIQIGGDGIWDTGPTLKPRQDILQAFGRFDYDLLDSVHFYTQASWTRDKTNNFFGDVNSNSLVLSSTNAFLPVAYQNQLTGAGINTFQFSKKYGNGDLVPRSNVDNSTDALYITAGLEGDIGEKWKWELNYSRSRVTLTTDSNFTFSNGPFFAAIDAVDEGLVRTGTRNGNIVCNVTITNPGLYPGCVPINLFGVGSESQTAVDYVRRQGQWVTKLPLDDINLTIAGSPFDLPAGPLQIALSGEWHRQGLETTSTNPTVDYAPLNCTGLRFNCTNATATNVGTPSFNGGIAPRPMVHMDVSEVALEADVPLLKGDAPFQSLSVNLAGRYADYRARGNPDITKPALTNPFSAWTWKVGIDWQLNDSLRLRATRSRDIRAPNLFELYRTNGTTFTNGNTDYLTGRQLTGAGTLPAVVNGGNPNLKPEVANTLTVGLVLKPFSNLSFAVDYYNIKVRDYITTLNGADQLFQQACYAGDAFYCSLQQRPGPITDTSAANAITKYFVLPANVAELSTSGVDFEANWRTGIGSRPLNLRGLLSYQPHVYFMQPGSRRQDFAGALGTPVAYQTSATLRFTIYASYKPTENLTIDWSTRFRGKLHQSPDPTLREEANAGAPAVSFSNLTVNYAMPFVLNGKATAFLNVTNVFNQMAPVAASYPASTSPGIAGGFVLGDDPIGRYFRFGVKLRM